MSRSSTKQVSCAKDVEIIATDLGYKFLHISSSNDVSWIRMLDHICLISGEAMHKFYRKYAGNHDAVLRLGSWRFPLKFNDKSFASVTNLIRDAQDAISCNSCHRTSDIIPSYMCLYCKQCRNKICLCCQYKTCWEGEGDDDDFKHVEVHQGGKVGICAECPQCKTLSPFDVKRYYVLLMDTLSRLSENQKSHVLGHASPYLDEKYKKRIKAFRELKKKEENLNMKDILPILDM